jgi:hypothetical protein
MSDYACVGLVGFILFMVALLIANNRYRFPNKYANNFSQHHSPSYPGHTVDWSTGEDETLVNWVSKEDLDKARMKACEDAYIQGIYNLADKCARDEARLSHRPLPSGTLFYNSNDSSDRR